MHPSDPIRRFIGADFSRLAQGIDVQSLWRWVKLGVAVGALTGLLTVCAYYVLEWAEAALFMRLAGHEQPVFGASHHLFDYARGPRTWWLIVLLPAAGGLVTGILFHFFDRSGVEGQGSEAMIDAYHNHDAYVSIRRSMLLVFASVFTLGTGGSGGREGPMAYGGAGFGSLFARKFKLSAKDRHLLLLAGAAGGISALFRAPLGGALFALEIIYLEDFESEGMFPVIVSSVTAYSVFTSFYGQGSLMSVHGGFDFSPTQLVFYGLMALAISPLAALWCKMHGRAATRAFRALPIPAWTRPALGGLLLGATALFAPWVIGSGYAWIQDALRAVDDPMRLLPTGYVGFGLLLCIGVAKMFATAFTLDSEGAGGTFAPTLVIGGFFGGAFGLLFHEMAPTIVQQPGAFVLVGMGAFYAGVAKVPLATIILISELFGSYDLLVPLMFCVVIMLLLLRHSALYHTQVKTRLESPAHAGSFTVDVLESLRVSDHYTRFRADEAIPAGMHLRAFLDHVAHTAESFFVVKNGAGDHIGSVSLEHVRSIIEDEEALEFLVVSDAMTPYFYVTPETSLGNALKKIVENDHEYAPVVDEQTPGTILGLISQRQIAAEYSAELIRRRLGPKRLQTGS